MSDALTFTITPFQLSHDPETVDSLTERYTNYWAGVQMPMRLISRTRRFSFLPRRQQLRRALAPLDDARDALTVYQTGDAAALVRLVAERRAALGRAITTLPDAHTVALALDRLAGGAGAASDTVADALRRASWRWRWIKNYLRAYTVMEREATPMGIDHYLVAWPDEYANAAALASVLRQTFQLPAVEQAPLPSLFAGQYHEEATALRPAQAGDPWLRVLSAYDIRGAWDLGSWQELLMGDQEVALCIDIQTLPRAKALRATTNAYNSLRVALTAKNAPKDAKSERAFGDVEYAMQALDQQGLHEATYALLIQAPTLRALDEQTQALRGQWGARLQLDAVPGAQGELIKLFTTTPAKAIQAPLIRRNSLSANIAVKVPWGIRKTREVTGTMWGHDALQNLPIHRDLFGVAGTDNAHLLCLAKAGSGKTVGISALALRQAVAGHQVVMFDPVAKVQWLCEAVGSDAICYDVDATATINILDPFSTDITRQLDHVSRKLSLVLGRVHEGSGTVSMTPRILSNFELGALDLALQSERVYGERGAYLGQLTPQTAPLLADLITALRETPVDEAASLAREIELICLGAKAPLYNGHTTLHWDFTAAVTGYNFKTAPKARWALLLDHGFGALNAYIRSPARQARRQKLVVALDEYGVMTQVEALRSEIASATREWRNYGAGMWTLDQTAQTYMGGAGSAEDFAQVTINNTAIKLIGRQEGNDVALLERAYGGLLTPAHLAAIRTAGPGEFIGIFGTEVFHLRVQLTDLEYPLFVRADRAPEAVG